MSVDSSMDLELQLKKRARRRLVGAIALVLLMVIVLPMVLRDRSADQPKPDVTITIPNEINNEVQHQAVQQPIAIAQVESKPVPHDLSANDKSQSNVNSLSSDSSPPVVVDNEPSQAEVKKTIEKITEKSTTEPKKLTQDDAKKPESSAISNAKFYVQIGVFSDADNVKKLQFKLTELGYKSQIEKVSTDKGEKIRLRTSNFKERNEAAIALENIKSSGMAGIVVSQK